MPIYTSNLVNNLIVYDRLGLSQWLIVNPYGPSGKKLLYKIPTAGLHPLHQKEHSPLFHSPPFAVHFLTCTASCKSITIHPSKHVSVSPASTRQSIDFLLMMGRDPKCHLFIYSRDTGWPAELIQHFVSFLQRQITPVLQNKDNKTSNCKFSKVEWTKYRYELDHNEICRHSLVPEWLH